MINAPVRCRRTVGARSHFKRALGVDRILAKSLNACLWFVVRQCHETAAWVSKLLGARRGGVSRTSPVAIASPVDNAFGTLVGSVQISIRHLRHTARVPSCPWTSSQLPTRRRSHPIEALQLFLAKRADPTRLRYLLRRSTRARPDDPNACCAPRIRSSPT
jgi:hypothetical protein